MSRCFPFPPPGYEKKARTDDADFLKKEKQKEKKHKKEKKDKERRENKEKKEKDKSDGKHKDKKDKKEKHKDRDKKKEKDRDKEKDRSNNLEEKKFPGRPEGQNGEKTTDEKQLPGKSEGHEKFIPKEKGSEKDRSSFSGEKKFAGQFSGYNGEKLSQSCQAEDFRDSKFVHELGRRVRDEGAGAGNQLVEKHMGTVPKRDEGMVRLVAKTANALVEEKEKNKRSDDRKSNVQGIRDETRSSGNAMVQNIVGAVNARVEGIPRQVGSSNERRDEGKDKTKEKKNDDKIRDKHKTKDGEKKSHGKDKDRDKEKKKKKKEEKTKAKGEHTNLELDNLKGSNKDDPVGTINPKASDSSKEGNKGAVVEENHRKRKDWENNGFLHVNDLKPNKLPRTSSSLLMDNGKTLESCQAPIPLASNSHGAGTGLKVNAKEHKLNGTSEAQVLSVSLATHLSASAQASQMDEVNGSQSKKPKVGFSRIDEAPQVWAEALQIESTDVCALPYVIPY
ncbi:hypothetical protein E1A91_A10G142500v1 [Gossypium mustelinum]|uniref:Uncharacterized protein n=1 Tax=Gossypium mustelinum TaxID=34275 RepID=A0A5D2XLR8_GOSMU|nr:hypothetical protein E1A91_A10G142500v1 [Gossypium mustelinum]